jgi:hypothetical protein
MATELSDRKQAVCSKRRVFVPTAICYVVASMLKQVHGTRRKQGKLIEAHRHINADGYQNVEPQPNRAFVQFTGGSVR